MCVFFPLVSIFAKTSTSLLLQKKKKPSTSGKWLEVTFIACEAKITPNPYKSLQALVNCLCIASQRGAPSKTFIEMEHVDRTHEIQAFFAQDYMTPRQFHLSSFQPTIFPGADIIATVKHIWTMMDESWDARLEAPPATPLSGQEC